MTNGSGGMYGPGNSQDKWSDWVLPQSGPENPYRVPNHQAPPPRYQAQQPPQQYQRQYQAPPPPYQPPQNNPNPNDDGKSKSSSLPYILATLLLTIVLAGGAIWYLSTQMSSNKDQSTAQERATSTTESTSAQPSTSPSPSSSSSTTTSRKKEHKPQPIGTKCGDINIATIYAATSVTSCEFAMEVGRVVGLRPEPEDGDRFNVQANSPVTNKNYTMKCAATGEPVTEIVCTGGNNAKVQVIIADTAS